MKVLQWSIIRFLPPALELAVDETMTNCVVKRERKEENRNQLILKCKNLVSMWNEKNESILFEDSLDSLDVLDVISRKREIYI